MKIRLAYGRDGIDLSLPDGVKVDIAQTVGQLRKRHGPSASVYVLPEGPQTISYISARQPAGGSTDCDSSRPARQA